MFLVKIEGGNIVKFPYTLDDLRAENPTVSFPEDPSSEILASFGTAQIFYHPFPVFDERTQYVNVAQVPTLVDGVWTMNHQVVNKTPEDIQLYDANALKVLRDKLCDQIDNKTTDLITYGFVFSGQKTRLNTEDQNNFEGAYGMVKDYLADGVPAQYIFPMQFKVWKNETDGSPVFISFANISQLKSFIYSGKIYIQACLARGWVLKGALSSMTLDQLRAWVDPR